MTITVQEEEWGGCIKPGKAVIPCDKNPRILLVWGGRGFNDG